jgi:hypothetical protein
MEQASIRTPVHLWIVGGVSALWNAFGAVDYVKTQTRNAAYLSSFPPDAMAYFDSLPPWLSAFWAFGVWGALLGSLLLLARSRFAVWAFALSLLGLAVTTVYQHVLTSPPASLMSGAMVGMTVAIWVIAIALLVYAMKMRARGVLR